MPKLTVVSAFVISRWFIDFPSRQHLTTYQNKRLKKHISFLRRESPYFRDFPQISTVEELNSLPMMDKKTMMDNFDSMNTVGLSKREALEIAVKAERTRNFTAQYNNISVGLSSGTSGHRGLFAISKFEREMWAGAIMAKFLPKNHFLNQRVALFLRADSNLYETISSRLIDFKYFDVYRDMNENIVSLIKYQPTILVAPPSVLIVIAGQIQSNGIKLQLQKLISVAEVLEPFDEKRLKKIFKQTIIYQIYQCTEGFLAYTCQKGSIHLNEESVIFEREYIDNKRFIPIITDFRRTTQPIIRYRLNDVLVDTNKKCDCGVGTAIIGAIEGREDDILVFKDYSGKILYVFADMVSRCMLYATGFNEYKVVQTSYTSLKIYLDILTAKTKQSVKKELQMLCNKMNFDSPEIVFELYKHDLSKKLKRIERKISV